ncbi:MAG: hypothetical protein IPK93_07730 [Solirubrobacterales bacterium]|nr:hypothetical protein [Solirubrobacterales bacterium]
MSEEESSQDPANPPAGPQDPAGQQDPQGPPPLTPEEQEMLEQQMSQVRVEDLLTQTVASVLNLSARRIVKEDEVDLDQARIGIEAVRALVALLPQEVADAVKEPLSQVQMLYAERAGGDPAAGPAPGGTDPAGGAPDSPGAGSGPESEPPKGPGLWTPRGS